MNEIPISAFEDAIQATHGAKAQFLSRERVDQAFEGQPIWQGDVLVFQLLDHPSARLCYAWEVDGEVTTVLGGGTVDSPTAAVRASTLASDFAAWEDKRR
jgi:hypothetical protein